MKINEIILVTENWKGTEINALMTIQDYLKFVGMETFDTQLELADFMVDLGRTLGEEQEWTEFYNMANRSISARYCIDEKQLGQFLRGDFNRMDQGWRFDESRCSEACMMKLKVLGMNTKGWITGMGLSYKKLEATFEQGQILHNFNNSDYRVMEKLSARNLLLMDIHSGNFTVAQGVDMYARHPAGEKPTEANSMIGIEWGQGLYFGATPSAIDFRYIRQEYGIPERIEDIAGYRDMLESKFKMYYRLAKDELLCDSVKSAATNAMYEEFGTGKPDIFMEKLEDGTYDSGFIGKKELERTR